MTRLTTRRTSWSSLALTAALLASGATSTADASLVATERVSVPDPSTGQTEATLGGDFPAVSADGSTVAFKSFSANLVVGDTNGVLDVFVRDRIAGTTERASVSTAGEQGDGESGRCRGRRGLKVAGNGRLVVFISGATNLVEGDSNGVCDLFLRDRDAGTTERVSLPDPATGESQANGPSMYPSVSLDGRYVAFFSSATNLVPGVSGPGVFVRDRARQRTVSVVSPKGDAISSPVLSGDGRYLAFLVSSGGIPNVGVYDRRSGRYERVSVDPEGNPGNGPSRIPALSGNGRFVAFQSDATNLVASDTNGVTDVFVRDLQLGVTQRVSVSSADQQGNGRSRYPSIGTDGSAVAFQSFATNLVEGDTNRKSDIFVRDIWAKTTGLVSLPDPSTGEMLSNGDSSAPSVNGDGTVIGFDSDADNLVLNDRNDSWDVFVRVA